MIEYIYVSSGYMYLCVCVCVCVFKDVQWMSVWFVLECVLVIVVCVRAGVDFFV